MFVGDRMWHSGARGRKFEYCSFFALASGYALPVVMNGKI